MVEQGERSSPGASARGSSVDESTFERDVFDLLEEAGALLITKHRDYGPNNIWGPQRTTESALNGLRVRMWDKLARINNLIDSGHTPEHEGLRDSFIDIANYGIIACLVVAGKWPTGDKR